METSLSAASQTRFLPHPKSMLDRFISETSGSVLTLWSNYCRPRLGEFALERVLFRASEASIANRSPPSSLDGLAPLD
jgi:hypothetical protein